MKQIVGDRFGIALIIASLLVIMLITGQFLMHRQTSQENSIKTEGRNVVALLSNLPYQQLIPKKRGSGILDLLNSRQTNSDFAYAAIVNLRGEPLAITSSGKAIVPRVDLGNEEKLWVTEHELQAQNDVRSIIEFRAPLLKEGELFGYIRVGYFKPSLELAEISFIAQLALPIFLLVPFTYWMIRRELKPLKQANVEINAAMQHQHINQVSSSNNEFKDFMNNFERFVSEIDKRSVKQSQQQFKSTASILALNYQRQRTESALQSLPDAILVMDETGKATFANSKLTPLIGGDIESIIGAKSHEWCQYPDIANLLAKYQHHQQRFQRSDSVNIIPEHNPNITVSVNAYPLFSSKEGDSICGTLVVFKDISSEILADLARGEFINHVSHELKSPLNVIHMYAESLLEPDLPNEQLISSINVINDEVERLSNLIGNLLNISKIEAGSIAINMQRVKLNEFLQDTFDSVARSGDGSDIQFELNLSQNLPNIQLDKDLLRVALNNVLTNAVKYNKPGGKVSFSAEETDEQIILTISDTGIGIAEKDQPYVFEKFYRSDDDEVTQRSGHGLGLALAKEIIDLHHGTLQLQSTVGEGSVFTIELKKSSSFLK
jgi:PAS domain S-box-containing protein